MKLQVGKKYLTKNGSVVHIKYNSNEMGFEWSVQPYGAYIEGRGAAFYCENGMYNLSNPDSPYNIIEEIE